MDGNVHSNEKYIGANILFVSLVVKRIKTFIAPMVKEKIIVIVVF